ncbi:MAG: MerR family transcriptional regulator [Firmicutes bacterium]|nr:MerR family transcriptional regulator [Bacillota bacterium]
MDKLFSIGEIAKLYQMNIRTLRYYDDIGLLKPEYVNPESGYRYYSLRQFERLNTIKYLRQIDLPIEQIREFLDNRSISAILDSFQAQKEELARRRRMLELMEQKIDRRIEQIRNAAASETGVVSFRQIGPRRAAIMRSDTRPDVTMEYTIRLLDRNAAQTTVFLGKIGLSVSRQNLLSRDFSSYSSLFILLDEEDVYHGQMEEISGGTFACLRFHGTHTDAPVYYGQLMDYCHSHDLEVGGDSVEITLIDSGLTSDPSQYITELQVPVHPAAPVNPDAIVNPAAPVHTAAIVNPAAPVCTP